MSGTAKIALWWLAFGGSHMLISSSRVRAPIIAWIGRGPYLAAYSVLAFALFVPLVGAYMAHRHEGALLWSVAPVGPVLWLLLAGNVVAFILIAAGIVTPSPVVVGSPYTSPRGVHYLTRHAMFMGTALWALLHMVPNGFVSDVVFFGGFVVVGVLGCWHQDRRKLAEGSEQFREFHAATPFFPFTGARTLRGLRELSLLGVIVGIGIALVVRFYHRDLFGG